MRRNRRRRAGTAGCPILLQNPADRHRTVAGMATIAAEGDLYFNIHTRQQTFYGDIRGQLHGTGQSQGETVQRTAAESGSGPSLGVAYSLDRPLTSEFAAIPTRRRIARFDSRLDHDRDLVHQTRLGRG